MEILSGYTEITTPAELARAHELGLTVYGTKAENPPDDGFIRWIDNWQSHVTENFGGYRYRVLGQHDLSPATQAEIDDATIGAGVGVGEFAERGPEEADAAENEALSGMMDAQLDDEPRFRLTVTIEADSIDGYTQALTALAEGL